MLHHILGNTNTRAQQTPYFVRVSIKVLLIACHRPKRAIFSSGARLKIGLCHTIAAQIRAEVMA